MLNSCIDGASSDPRRLLTHVELSDEASHVVVFEILWQDFLSEASLVKDMETRPRLKEIRLAINVNSVCVYVCVCRNEFLFLVYL